MSGRNFGKILQNEVKCLNCGDQIYSRHRHDFVTCKCGSVSVDGGLSYLKRSFSENTGYEDLSIIVSEKVYNGCIDAIDWAEENGRNNLGLVCAIFRSFRDNGYELRKKEVNND